MDEFITQLLACEERQVSTPQSHISTIGEIPAGIHLEDIADTTSVAVTEESKLDFEIAILTEKYGTLEPGMVITLDIATACDLLHKKRRRSDTFKKLQKELGEMGVTLQITSRKHVKI